MWAINYLNTQDTHKHLFLLFFNLQNKSQYLWSYKEILNLIWFLGLGLLYYVYRLDS
jgi:hypothetical protein